LKRSVSNPSRMMWGQWRLRSRSNFHRRIDQDSQDKKGLLDFTGEKDFLYPFNNELQPCLKTIHLL